MKAPFELVMRWKNGSDYETGITLRLPYFFEDTTLTTIKKAMRKVDCATDACKCGFERYMRNHIFTVKADISLKKVGIGEYKRRDPIHAAIRQDIIHLEKYLEKLRKICKYYEEKTNRHPKWEG